MYGRRFGIGQRTGDKRRAVHAAEAKRVVSFNSITLRAAFHPSSRYLANLDRASERSTLDVFASRKVKQLYAGSDNHQHIIVAIAGYEEIEHTQ